MSAINTEGPSYFALPRKQHRSGESQEGISPLSGPAATPPLLRTLRLHTGPRSQSDNTYSRFRSHFHPLEEELRSTCHSTPTRTPVDRRSLEDSNVEVSELDLSHTDPASPSTLTQFSKAELRSQFRGSHASSTDAKSERTVRHSRASQALTRPFAALYRIERSISSRDHTTSLRSILRREQSSEATRLSIQPLRPPSVVTEQSLPRPEHRIRVEQSFPDLRTQAFIQDMPDSKPRRSSSVGPRYLLSVSRDLVQRLGRKPRMQSIDYKNSLMKSTYSTMIARDHQSSLRRQHTDMGLARVASMLQELKRMDNRDQALQRITSSSRKLPELGNNSKDDIMRLPIWAARTKTTELDLADTESQTSSLARLQMGQNPNNTPEESATYAIVNQDGNVEEYLKVDISIRGQTSYLPSEARRIHTPPLPSEAPDGRRRGFFFDYDVSQECHLKSTPRNTEEDPMVASITFKLSSKGSDTSHVPTISKQTPNRNLKHCAKFKPGDWYDAKLAEIDSSLDDEEGSSQFQPGNLTSTKPATCTFTVEQQRIQDEAQLDQTIPEHLPTSPLCPRHPRYWRIVKNKESQFRGCWMHGFGEFTQAEKEKYKIVDKVKF